MTARFQNQTIGFKRSSSYADDLISLASTEYYQFGKQNILWGSFPTEKRDLNIHVTGAARTPQDVYFPGYAVGTAMNVTAVNAIPLYYALGKTTNSGSNPYTHVLEGADVGSALPDFLLRSEDYSSETGIYDSYLGNYIKNLNFSIDFRQRANMAVYGINGVGQRIATPQFAGVSEPGKLIIPGAHDKHFMWSNAMVANWGGTFSSGVYSSGGTAITDDILDFSLVIDNSLTPDKPQSQSYPADYVFGNQVFVATFDIMRQSANSKIVYTDFLTMQDGSTKKNFHFKIYQDTTHYIQVDMENFTLGGVTRNNTVGTKELPIFTCQGIFQTIKVTAYDPLIGSTWYI